MAVKINKITEYLRRSELGSGHNTLLRMSKIHKILTNENPNIEVETGPWASLKFNGSGSTFIILFHYLKVRQIAI